MGIRELFGTMFQPAVSGEKRQRGRVADRRLDTVGAEIRGERIAARMLDRVKMVDVGTIRRDLGYNDVFDLIKAGVVSRGGVLARPGPVGQMGNLADRIAACRPSSRLLMPSI